MIHRPGTSFDELRSHLRYAARTLLRAPSFMVAVLSLGLAIGTTTAVYGTADWLLSRSPGGVVEPERLVGLWVTERGREDDVRSRIAFSLSQYESMREFQDAFVDIGAYAKLLRVAATDDWEAEVVFQFVSGSYFSVLGVRPLLGRLVGPEDDLEGAPPVAVLTHAFWQSNFGGDLDVIGAPIRLQGAEARVIGVLPAEFEDYSLDWNAPTGLWLPIHAATAMGLEVMLTSPTGFFPIIGRLRSDITAEIAAQRVPDWFAELPVMRSPGVFEPNTIIVQPGSEMRIARRAEAKVFLDALLIVCTLILLAACFNVANFFLGRATARRQEMAVRSALGAGRGTLLRQLLTESFLFAAATATVAIAVGVVGTELLAPLPAVYLDLPARGGVLTTAGAADLKMMFGTAGVGLLTAIVFGLLPMLGTFGDPMAAIRGSTAAWSWGRVRPTLRQGVLVLQIGLAVVLSITAAMYAQGFGRATRVDSEYVDPESVLMVRVIEVGPRGADRSDFFHSLVDRLENAQGIVSVGLSFNPPYAGGRGVVALPDDPDGSFEIDGESAGPGVFQTLGFPLVAGRDFSDTETSADAAIINRSLADQLWPDADPVGRQLVFNGATVRVVGVVARERCKDVLAEPGPCGWRPPPLSRGGLTLNIRTAGPPMAFVPELRALIRELSPDFTIAGPQSLDALLLDRIRAERTTAVASAGLALFGILLLVIGCISLFLSMVRDSLREIAIRMALGATGARLTTTIGSRGLLLTTLGVVTGLVASVGVGTRLKDQFYGMSATDLPTLVVVSSLILLLAMLAVGYSALAATRTDPAEYLHLE